GRPRRSPDSSLSLDQVAPYDRVVRDVHRLRAGLNGDAAVACGHDLAAYASPFLCAKRDAAPECVAEVLWPADRTLEARRRDVYRVLAQVVTQHVGDTLAKGVVDALGVVDVDGEPLRSREFHREHFGAGDRALDLVRDLPRQLLFLVVRGCQSAPVTKNGPAGPFRKPLEMWCGQCSKARDQAVSSGIGAARAAQSSTIVTGP